MICVAIYISGCLMQNDPITFYNITSHFSPLSKLARVIEHCKIGRNCMWYSTVLSFANLQKG